MAVLRAMEETVIVTLNRGREDQLAKPLPGNAMIGDVAITMVKKEARRRHGLPVVGAIIMGATVNRAVVMEEPRAAVRGVLLHGNDEMQLQLPMDNKIMATVVIQAQGTANLRAATDSPTWVLLQA